MERIRRCNMAIYAGRVLDEDPDIPRRLGEQFGLHRLDANWLAGEDGISEIRVFDDGTQKLYIPYTDRPIKWHTDGYYNPPEWQIRGMVLHCVRPAATGGENRLMDHEMAYLLLREAGAGTCPGADAAGRDAHSRSGWTNRMACARRRAARSSRSTRTDTCTCATPHGPAASPGSRMPPRRPPSRRWKRLLASDSPSILQAQLEPGMGLLCNNVLHDRAAFRDDPARPRLLYRARYLDRIV